MSKKAAWAKWLFYSLPKEEQANVRSFLTRSEWQQLKQTPWERPPISQELQEMQWHLKKLEKPYNIFSLAWAMFLLGCALVAYGTTQNALVILFCIYGVVGFFLLSRRSHHYWKFMFSFSADLKEFSKNLILSFLTFMLVYGLTSLPNMYSLERVSILFFLRAAFLAPIFEEILFRDFVFRPKAASFSASSSLFVSLFVSSVLFAAVHISDFKNLSWDVLFVVFSAGLLLGLLRFFSNKLLWPILVHAGSNMAHLWGL